MKKKEKLSKAEKAERAERAKAEEAAEKVRKLDEFRQDDTRRKAAGGKSTPGYISRTRKTNFIWLAVWIFIGVAIFVTGMLIWQTRTNLLTVLAVLMVLPGAKRVVALVAIGRKKSIDLERCRRLETAVEPFIYAGDLDLSEYEPEEEYDTDEETQEDTEDQADEAEEAEMGRSESEKSEEGKERGEEAVEEEEALEEASEEGASREDEAATEASEEGREEEAGEGTEEAASEEGTEGEPEEDDGEEEVPEEPEQVYPEEREIEENVIFTDYIFTSTEKIMMLDFLVVMRETIFILPSPTNQDQDYVKKYLVKGIRNASDQFDISFVWDDDKLISSIEKLREGSAPARERREVIAYLKSLAM